MPTIYKPKNRRPTEKRQERQDIYQSETWRRLRNSYLMEHPLCEICQEKGIIEPAVDIHHKDSFLNYKGLQRLDRAYDYNNLQALCKRCHQEIHNKH